ncbi:YesL family protein [Litchfieldia salsa]|uniref:Uncharacterized membrane protein YesL n=1 Tax=Litchfieldia salsa TaxID=930152 RepID=A0A1H0PEP4_9BACI|nr:DUF624 domain-containing protein [Litchfieldia salsa]SDP03155.1 Uncharacterized membrane protein YesL [Litchfieldia salsa]
MQTVTTWYIRFGDWALKLFLLNLLWILFSFVGLFIGGIFPATVALFAVMRKLLMSDENENIPLFKLFWTTYKKDFFKANFLGYPLLIGGLILFVNLRVLQQLDSSPINMLLNGATLIIAFLYLMTLLNLFPVFVHFNLRNFQYFKYAFVLSVGKPLQSILLIAGVIITIFVLLQVPGLIPVFGVSVLSLVVMKIALSSFPERDNTI